MLPNDNYLFAENVILERLSTGMGAGVHVASINVSDDMITAKHSFPGVFVLFAGDEVLNTTAGQGKASQSVQHWIVVSAAKSSENMESGKKAREIAGKLVYKVLTLLQGYEVAPAMTLVRTSSALPILYHSGYIFIASEFLLTVNVVGK